MTARWYVVHAHSGFERKVEQAIRERSLREGVEGMIEEVLVPTEEVLEVRRGTRVTRERKFYPGYVLVKMELSDRTWHLIKNTPKVTGFLGGKGGMTPTPITDAEANRILYQIDQGVERPRPSVVYVVGEEVRVSDGPFTSFTGFVEEVDEDRARLKLSVSIFGRATPVDLEYSQVEKV